MNYPEFLKMRLSLKSHSILSALWWKKEKKRKEVKLRRREKKKKKSAFRPLRCHTALSGRLCATTTERTLRNPARICLDFAWTLPGEAGFVGAFSFYSFPSLE